MRFVYKRSFLKALDEADAFLKRLILQTDKDIKDYLETGKASYGLRVKRIGKRSFEGRVSDKVRIVWVKEKDLVSFVLVGNHQEVQSYLRNS
ncbi:MAG: hypothetical protein Q7S00_07230 [bacterium]|nr:hypothetical protein [bacterium]